MFIRHLQKPVKFAEISDSETIIIISNYNSRKRIAIDTIVPQLNKCLKFEAVGGGGGGGRGH